MNAQRISVSALDDLVAREKCLLVDLRDSLSYRCSHLPAALNVRPNRLNLLRQNINKDLTIIFYCDFGEESQAVAELFGEFGFRHCLSLEGGFEEWMLQRTRQAKMTDDLCEWLAANDYSCRDLEKRGFNGETALLFAARSGRTDYLVELLDRGANVDTRNNDGNTAVWLACYSNDIHSLRELIQCGADLNVQNDNGATALIYAASAGREVMVKTLVEAGADPFRKTLDDFTALDVAATLPILRYLKRAMKMNQSFAC